MEKTLKRRFLDVAKKVGIHRMVSLAGETALKMGFDEVPGGNGISFRVPRTMSGAAYAALWLKQYEQPELSLIRKHFQPDHTILDIGANIGFVSSHVFQEKLLPGGIMICIEANPDSQDALRENMMKTKVSADAIKFFAVVQAALVDNERTKKVEFSKQRNLGSHVITEDEIVPADAQRISVEAVTMDTLVKRYAPNGYSLVCDIEGGEMALFSSQKALSSCRQVLVELHEEPLARKGHSFDRAVSRFEDMGFKLHGRDLNSFAFFRPS